MMKLLPLLLLLALATSHMARADKPGVAPTDCQLLVLAQDSIQAYDLATGADLGLFISRSSTNGVIWGLDSIAQRANDKLLYIGTYYGDSTSDQAFPGEGKGAAQMG